MFADLFDSPWKILIIAAVILVLFGSKKLPGAARSLGQSMRILKAEVAELHNDDEPAAPEASPVAAAVPPPVQLTAHTSQAAHDDQVAALQQQLDELRRQQSVAPATPVTR